MNLEILEIHVRFVRFLVTDISVQVAEDPLSCVAIGTGRALEELRAISQSDHRQIVSN